MPAKCVRSPSVLLHLILIAISSGKYAAQKRARSVDDAALQAGCATELTDFYNNFGGFYNILCLLNEIAVCCPNVGVGKGRDCYDDSSVTEQLLKDVVDYTKDTLTATRTLVAGIPVLGPLLDPSKSSTV
jgi:hypothetical protein